MPSHLSARSLYQSAAIIRQSVLLHAPLRRQILGRVKHIRRLLQARMPPRKRRRPDDPLTPSASPARHLNTPAADSQSSGQAVPAAGPSGNTPPGLRRSPRNVPAVASSNPQSKGAMNKDIRLCSN